MECNVGYEQNKVLAKPLDGTQPFYIEENHPVSMNMFGFKKSVLQDLETYFEEYLKNNLDNLEKAECLLTDFLEEYLNQGKIILKYATSKGEWLGMTYKEDLLEVEEKLKELKNKGEYQTHLWE